MDIQGGATKTSESLETLLQEFLFVFNAWRKVSGQSSMALDEFRPHHPSHTRPPSSTPFMLLAVVMRSLNSNLVTVTPADWVTRQHMAMIMVLSFDLISQQCNCNISSISLFQIMD
jgi:hypothetical protein